MFKILALAFGICFLCSCSLPPPGTASFTIVSEKGGNTSRYYTTEEGTVGGGLRLILGVGD